MEQIPHAHNANLGTEQRPVSHLSIWSMILGILFLCFGPLAMIPLILGIIGLTQTGRQGPKGGFGFAVAGTTLGAVGVLGTCVLGIFLPALGAARQTANVLVSQTQIRSQIHAANLFAENHGDQFPQQSEWPDALIDAGLLEPGILVSPFEDGDGVSYIYLGGASSNDPTQILLYEDPKHIEDFVLVGFATGDVVEMPHDEFERRLAEQLRTTDP